MVVEYKNKKKVAYVTDNLSFLSINSLIIEHMLVHSRFPMTSQLVGEAF